MQDHVRQFFGKLFLDEHLKEMKSRNFFPAFFVSVYMQEKGGKGTILKILLYFLQNDFFYIKSGDAVAHLALSSGVPAALQGFFFAGSG